MLKEQKGITLVALIITIIVMLILAGVSISLVVGENGVLTQAEQAGEAQKAGAVKEAIALGGADFYAACYSASNDTNGELGGDSDYNTVANLKLCIQKNYEEGTATISLKTTDTTPVDVEDDDITSTGINAVLTLDGEDVSVTLTKKTSGVISIKAN